MQFVVAVPALVLALLLVLMFYFLFARCSPAHVVVRVVLDDLKRHDARSCVRDAAHKRQQYCY